MRLTGVMLAVKAMLYWTVEEKVELRDEILSQSMLQPSPMVKTFGK